MRRPVLRIRSLIPDKTTLLIVLAALVGVAPRLVVGVRQYIEYDGWWHIFIAQQDVWSNFVWEYKHSAHPPLFLLLLKAAMLFGKSRLAYRSVSLVAGILTICALGRLVDRQSRHRAVAPIVALGFALSWNATVISCEVRSYALCVLFLTIVAYAFLELSHLQIHSAARYSLIFCVASALALLSHYSTGLVLVAMGAVLAARVVLVQGYRRRVLVVLRRMPFRLLLPAGIPLGTAAFLYLTHARIHVDAMNHLPEFHLATSTAGGPVRFLVRNTALLVGHFLPFGPDLEGLGTQITVVVTAALVVLAVLLIPRPRGRRAVHRLTGGLVLALLLLAMVLGLRSAYPYGGALRHQFYLFPFVLLFLATGLDAVMAWVRIRVVRAGILLAVLLVLIGGFVVGATRFAWFPEELFKKEVPRSWPGLSESPAVYLDRYTLPAFFSAYHDWAWCSAGAVPRHEWIMRYTLRKDGRTLTVLRDRIRWSVDLEEERTGQDLRGCIESVAPSPLAVFALRQRPDKDGPGSVAARERQARAREALGRSGIVIGRLEESRSSAFLVLLPAPTTEQAR